MNRICHSFRLGPIALLLLAAVVMAAPAKPKAKKPKKAPPAEPVVETESLAQPADSLAGELVRQRPEADRKFENDLLNSVDLAKDVVYATSDRPVPENQQYQFIDGVLRTPEKEDARLCFPVKVPAYYRLSIDGFHRPLADQKAPLGVGGVIEGHQFFGEFRDYKITFGQFFGHKLYNRLIGRAAKREEPMLRDGAEILVSPWGVMFRRQNSYFEWMAAPSAWSLDEAWRVPAKDQLFLVFPEGQYDIHSVKFDPMDEETWIKAVTTSEPECKLAWAGKYIDSVKIKADTNPFPEDNALRQAILLQARRADFDELERWADRFRKGDIIVDERYGAEYFYDWLTSAYAPTTSGSQGGMEAFYQGQFAFIDEWLKQKPDSVAARIVKGRSYCDYAWDARGHGFADKVPDAAWKPFAERLEIAQTTLEEAAEMKPRDVCVYSSQLYLGRLLDWDREKMLKTLEAGLKITKKDASLLDAMLLSLLPRWGGAPGDMGAFALWTAEHIKGPDGLDAYGRIARLAQMEEVGLKRRLKGQSPEAYCNLTDPAVVLAEFSSTKLKAALPIMRKRHPKSKRVKNYACWISCVLEERGPAKELFADIGDKPDLAIWETKENYDHWRQWSESGK